VDYTPFIESLVQLAIGLCVVRLELTSLKRHFRGHQQPLGGAAGALDGQPR
jgi:hypothetical protein